MAALLRWVPICRSVCLAPMPLTRPEADFPDISAQR